MCLTKMAVRRGSTSVCFNGDHSTCSVFWLHYICFWTGPLISSFLFFICLFVGILRSLSQAVTRGMVKRFYWPLIWLKANFMIQLSNMICMHSSLSKSYQAENCHRMIPATCIRSPWCLYLDKQNIVNIWRAKTL